MVPFEIFIEKGILPGLTTLNRDEMAAVRHGSEIINHVQTIARYKEYHRIRQPEYLAQQAKRMAD
jgi:hypothetical protein